MNLEEKQIKLILRDTHIFLTDQHFIDISDVDIGNVKSFKESAYWIVEILRHNAGNGNLYVNVVEGGIGKTEFELDLLQLSSVLSTVKSITVRNVSTNILLSTTVPLNRPVSIKNATVTPSNYINITDHPPQKNSSDQINETIIVTPENFSIENGHASIRHKFAKHFEPIEVKIYNNYLQASFDSVKAYFLRCLGTKEIQVTVNIEIKNGFVTSSIGTSRQIESINSDLMEQVELAIVQDSYEKRHRIHTETAFITKEQFIDQSLKDKGKFGLLLNEQTLLNGLIKASKTKHHKNLEYLADLHKASFEKLRLVMKPFSFVFLLEGSSQYFIIWETLNGTDATYIWAFPKDATRVKQYYHSTEATLNRINAIGRNDYIRLNDPNFSRVNHDYSDIEKGYEIWKTAFEKVIK